MNSYKFFGPYVPGRYVKVHINDVGEICLWQKSSIELLGGASEIPSGLAGYSIKERVDGADKTGSGDNRGHRTDV